MTDSPRFGENQALQEILQFLNGAMKAATAVVQTATSATRKWRRQPRRHVLQRTRRFKKILLFMITEIVFQIWSTPGSTVELQRWCRLQLLTMRASGDASRTGTHVRDRVVCPSCVHSNGLRPFCREYVATEVKGLRTQREFAN